MFFMDKWEHCFSYLSQTSGCTVVLAKYLFGAFCIYSVTFYSVDQTKERIYEVLIRDRKADISITLRNSLFYFVEIFHLLPHLRRMFLSRKFYNNITNKYIWYFTVIIDKHFSKNWDIFINMTCLFSLSIQSISLYWFFIIYCFSWLLSFYIDIVHDLFPWLLFDRR